MTVRRPLVESAGFTRELPLGDALAETGWTKKTSDFSTTSTTFVDVTQFTFAVAANTLYRFKFDVIFSTANATRGVSFAVNGPASPNFCVASYKIYDATSSPIDAFDRAYDTGATSLSQDTANVPVPATIEGLLSTGATSGTFALRFHAENAGFAAKVLTGSIGRIDAVVP